MCSFKATVVLKVFIMDDGGEINRAKALSDELTASLLLETGPHLNPLIYPVVRL